MESKYEDFVPATAEERRASMCCARSAYHAIRSQQSQESYEEAIANKAADGINQPPGSLLLISVVSDKVTYSRNTYLITGVTLPIQGKMITAVIDASVVTDHTGGRIAKQQMDGLKEFVKEEDLKTRLYTKTCMKENNFRKRESEAEIMEQRLKLEEQPLDTANGKLDAVEKWTTFTWDPAHLVELGDKDMKKREEGKFPKSVEKIVTEVQKGVRCGKSYMELSIEMQNENKEPRAINAFSDTRFAYEGRILNNFNHNLPGLYNHLNKIGILWQIG
ncbi:hypothetical protein Fcan01_24407 [Folsomia candida]|uniref:Uncharacterized protein n=1 Tax=Folsomia candida TaxID=158441 RepID=A0A226D8S8_FOLCA|nr:hypothetical protein Fcan01_24407 [Folsomia candida]